MNWFARRGITRTDEDVMILQIPDVRQQSDFDCGAACIEAVLQLGGRTPPDSLANPVQGMAPDTLEAVLRSVGVRVISGTMCVDDLKHFTRGGRPVICPTDIEGGHWVIVAGVGRGRVHYHDPDAGMQSVAESKWRSLWCGSTRFGHAFDRWGIAAG